MQCKAIAKSTGKPCKRAAVQDGLCRYHLPRDLPVKDKPRQEENDRNKNLSLGNAFLNQQHTTRDKNRFIRVIVVSTRRKKK
ncbi:MAG: DUF5763 domain-containing protein [Gammaproteobacteria bacterium]|nr:DUF5763 domain-containing protein [Gammaproteobacteria bacterium]